MESKKSAPTLVVFPGRADKGTDDGVERIDRLLRQLSDKGFFGRVTIHMQNGRPLQAVIEQTVKVDEIK